LDLQLPIQSVPITTNVVSLNPGFIGAGNHRKTTNLPQVTDKSLSHNVVSSTPLHEQD
jgi:hypothetical protein